MRGKSVHVLVNAMSDKKFEANTPSTGSLGAHSLFEFDSTTTEQQAQEGNKDATEIRLDWYTISPECELRLHTPGIYEWIAADLGVYIGQYTNPSRPVKDYKRNVLKLKNGEAYRKNNRDGFRDIHRKLFEVYSDPTKKATVKILENHPDKKVRNVLEQNWIKKT
jgi:hypothetical protein